MFLSDSLVDRVRAYNVDGGRAYLPAYQQHHVAGGDADEPSEGSWRFTVEPWPYELTRLVNRLDSQHDFDSYIAQVGFEIVGS
ncbi:hypothetical protein [Microbacterium sp. MM2322]|uniref:hypothetical protein n=1 Tax=Microbacterium sp. MM2322 TaxID=3157631 RepID=UPI003D801418